MIKKKQKVSVVPTESAAHAQETTIGEETHKFNEHLAIDREGTSGAYSMQPPVEKSVSVSDYLQQMVNNL